MADFLFLMHDDAAAPTADWGPYLARLRAANRLEGGSAVGEGLCLKKAGVATAVTAHISGFILIEAADLAEAQSLVAGNPVFEAGGTVEIRALPRTD